jgi:hypothetical protein
MLEAEHEDGILLQSATKPSNFITLKSTGNFILELIIIDDITEDSAKVESRNKLSLNFQQ